MAKSKLFEYADEKQAKLYEQFPNTFLGNPENLDHVFKWNTFFRRNLHRLAIDYLGIKLRIYQALLLYLMGICKFIAVIASRSTAKSFIVALYCCCRCITRPYTKIVLASGTKGQANLIVSEKIKNELMNLSPMLCSHIKNITDNKMATIVEFNNKSTITVVPASDNARGYRSTGLVREEFRMIDKYIDDTVLTPFQIVRPAPYIFNEFYANNKELLEESVDVYISSSWLDNGHWMWNIVKQAQEGMFNYEDYCLLAFDEALVLREGIKTMKQLQIAKRKTDSLSWRIEYLNERVKENTDAYFTYKMFSDNQRCKKPFYPRRLYDIANHKKNPYAIPKQTGEIRVVACDMAFVVGKQNDNSIYTLIRAIPEIENYQTKEGQDSKSFTKGYRRIVTYIESVQGWEVKRQSLRIKQLFEDFDADYCVLDTRNAGVAVKQDLCRVLYDDERDKEYDAWNCINDNSNNLGGKPVLYVINASQSLNSAIAIGFRNTLVNQKIDFLMPYNYAVENLLNKIPEYHTTDLDTQIFFEKPYLETQELINESIELIYEKKEQTGAIVISEQGNNRKDRYSSCSYGDYFISQLEQDLFANNSCYTPCVFIN